MKKIDGGVTAAKGFYAGAAQAGIKYANRNDMAVVYCEKPCATAATFTTNVVKAAPVKWDIQLLKEHSEIQAVVLNSGSANACTGDEGDRNNEKMAELTAAAFKINKNNVFTASTGVIGKNLPMDAIERGVSLLAQNTGNDREHANLAARAIMTTDTYEKECAVEFDINGTTVHIGGMSKGSGMIHPNMATMLGVITTDADIEAELLQAAVSAAVKVSFNMISVDRDTSTNDSLMVMASGLAGNKKIIEKNSEYDIFYDALEYVLKTLAKKMAADGEGASKLIEVKVLNAPDYEMAAKLSKSVITSPLVKAAVFGNDANWGRIMCALGYAGVNFNADKVDIYYEGRDELDGEINSYGRLQLVHNGIDADYSEETATKILSSKVFTVTADMNSGAACATAWGCDLTYDYVKINADYRS